MIGWQGAGKWFYFILIGLSFQASFCFTCILRFISGKDKNSVNIFRKRNYCVTVLLPVCYKPYCFAL
ncbi:hypothetical protein CUB97_07150 [Prevotella intermedia]|uniref:Uncharacterized protein n=1 Tax=Prevotella intermedia TaxID=28131 RepID=A0A2M8M9X4_PREIN|nr:hypothetical protein CUB97_07150 [Prevotella intermedia]